MADCKWDPRVLDNTIEDIDAWANSFKELQSEFSAINEEISPRDIMQNPFDESGYYIDKASSQKDPPINAQRLETVHVAETTELHAEDRGDIPHDPPTLLMGNTQKIEKKSTKTTNEWKHTKKMEKKATNML